jgi:hypothetical protein
VNVLRWSILITSLSLISGCASFGNLFGTTVKPVEVKTVAVERTRLNLSDPPPVKVRDVEWIVITPENAEQVWASLKEKNTDLVLISLSDEGYEQLAITIAELRNLIATQRSIILKYKEYYEPRESTGQNK